MKIILYIATSKDGFIADEQGGVDWLPHPDDEKDIFGYEKLMSRVSTIIMGRHSYEQILSFGSWAWQDKQTYVFSSKQLTAEQPYIHIIQEKPIGLVARLQQQDPNQAIWLLGGAEMVKSFSADNLIDEYIITIIPINLGKGIKLVLPYKDFELIHTQKEVSNISQQTYVKK